MFFKPSFRTLRPKVIAVVSVPVREQWCFGHDARHFWSHCLKLLKVYCYCIICWITILKVFNNNFIKQKYTFFKVSELTGGKLFGKI